MDTPIYRLPTDRYAQWTPGQRDAARDWLAAHGINHNRVPLGQIITITDDGPGGRCWLSTTLMVTSNGRHVLDPGDPNRVLTEPVRVPLTQYPPVVLDEWAIRTANPAGGCPGIGCEMPAGHTSHHSVPGPTGWLERG